MFDEPYIPSIGQYVNIYDFPSLWNLPYYGSYRVKYKRYFPDYMTANGFIRHKLNCKCNICKSIRYFKDDARKERLDEIKIVNVPAFREEPIIFRWGYSHCN